MKNDLTGIWTAVQRGVWRNRGQIFTVHLIYAALGVTLLTPLAGVFGRLLLQLSGQPAIADQDIVYFLLTPFGLAALIIFSALLIAILAFEQASLMAISAGTAQGLHTGARQALYFTAGRALAILSFTIQLAARVLVITLPFLAAAGTIAWMLITDHDINYYLTETPPAFLVAASLIVLLLFGMLSLLIRQLLTWSLSLPLILFAGVPPARSFAESGRLTRGTRGVILASLALWALAALLLSSVVLGSVHFLGSRLVPLFFQSIDWLSLMLGGLVLLWLLGNLLVTVLTSGSFAFLLTELHLRLGAKIEQNSITCSWQQPKFWRLRMTAPRLVLLLVGGTMVAALAGFWLIDGVQTDDNVLIVAHRGAAGKAPENTLASVQQAIEDGADWIEIDVQESKDGEVVVIHDSDFMKLAGVSMKVWEGTLKQLREIDIGSWFSPDFSAERVPTLTEVLAAARGRSRVVIELKYYGHDRQLEQRVVDAVEYADMVDEVAIMSLNYDGIRKIRKLRPDWRVGLLSARAIGNLAGLDVDFLAVNTGMVNRRLIHNTHSAGKRLFVWTVNDPVSISLMMSLGVDGIITDEPGIAREVVTDRLEMSSIERLLIHTAALFGQPVGLKRYRDQSP